MHTLLIDNHDSYTYNLFQLIAQVYGTPPIVVTNDDAELLTLAIDEFDAIVISPGPGHPARERDLGIARAVMERTAVPLLGVCLGHQAIGLLEGAQVVLAPRPRHGHLSRVRHNGRDLFEGLPQHFVAVRYHSLCVPTEGLPSALEPTAWAEDGVLMGLRHRRRPMWGVQFHPESFASEHGARLIENFGRIAAKALAGKGKRLRPLTVERAIPTVAVRTDVNRLPWRLLHCEIAREVDTAAVFTEVFGGLDYAFWLDSSRVEPGLSRFSFLGAPEGPEGEVLTYSIDRGLTIRTGLESVTRKETVFEALRARLAEPVHRAPDLPFDLAGGYVGYFGYELKAELGSPNRHRSPTPEAIWLSTTRLVVVDHEKAVTHLLALTRSSSNDSASAAWLQHTRRRLVDLRPLPEATPPILGECGPEPALLCTRRSYLDDIEACQRQLRAGESYEICLTTRARVPMNADPLTLYMVQRRANPAPYSAFLRLGDLSVLCSSPERFLRIDRNRTVETKPIKGTSPRGRDPVEDVRLRAQLSKDPKARAEHLMIVDLLRNDLGQVCEIGSVHVASYMNVESYATVHQLVSTLRGRLSPDVDAITCIQACFPGGSMTGAPKKRTLEILDQLEGTARGIYSGCIGFLAFNGTVDLNIAIRTAVADGDGLSVGAGGAIVLDSDPSDEFEEMLLKAQAPLRGMARVPPPVMARPDVMEAQR